MKGYFAFCAAILSLAILVAGCGGGGGTGGGGEIVGGGGTATGTFTKEVAFTTVPDYWYGTEEARFMNLYLAEDIHGSGWITSISVRHHPALASPATCPNMTIRMGHTASDNLVTSFAANVENGKGSFQTVLSGAVSVPAGGADTYYSIPLSQPFYYNGVDNLVVDLTYLSSCSASAGIVAHATPYDANVFETGPGSSTDPTGSVVAQVIDMKFHFAGGDDALVYNGVAMSYCAPFCDNLWRHLQTLHLAADINGSGPIVGVGMVVDALTANATYTATIKLGHSQQNMLASTNFSEHFDYGTPVTVANNVVFTVPANAPAGTTLWLPITSSFNYDGTHNLIVDIDISSGSAVDHPWRATSIAGRSVYGVAGSTIGTGISSDALHTKFRFAGGTMDVITTENVFLSFPYGTAPNKQQFLYRAAELGTKGSISRLAYRLRSDSIASSYGSFELVLGHTASTTLGDTSFSGNMTGAQSVYSGTYSIPAGLKAGDWMEIPLSTPFAYDGVSNLVVQTSNLNGSVNSIFAESSLTRYPDRRAYLNNNTGDDPSANDEILADLRLIMQ